MNLGTEEHHVSSGYQDVHVQMSGELPRSVGVFPESIKGSNVMVCDLIPQQSSVIALLY